MSRRTDACLLVAVAGVALSFAAFPFAAAAAPAAAKAHHSIHACAAPPSKSAACHALVRTDVSAAQVAPNTAPAGFGPADLRSAYNLPSTTAGGGRTVAIVDAYNDPTAAADLNVYRAQYGLPACTTANGCFKKINQNGGGTMPRTNGGWAQEISLDLDMVSAICPLCHITLVEANSASFTNLGVAENRAASLAPSAISNSWGGPDEPDSVYGSYFHHAGVAITASTGDGGYGVEYPASSQYVTAVGGTSLTRAGTAWSQTAWSGAGSGCSSYNVALPGQAAVNTGCGARAVADVSAVADPNTGVAVYDSTAYQGLSGWLVFGGTSVASPVIAATFALAGNTAAIDDNYPYTHDAGGDLTDVTSGSNGTCPDSQWCNAGTGWDGPTGLGTPNGIGAF